MDIITTSLEALIQRATNVSNQGPDTAGINAFCGLINKEPECAQMAAKFIIAKVHSLHEWEALQALVLLESCMKRCGPVFHAEVGKFRFLNELIKLVSPKYLGAHTPEPVRKRVIELMQLWTRQHPKETKIKEAYDMLKKQGVVKEEVQQHPSPKELTPSRQHQSSILQDEEKSQLLQKLLQSKNPEDLQAANRLIKSMVKEDERRVEEKWRHTLELETVVNNCRLLKEMLDNYNPETSSTQDLELIRELHTTCQNLRPVIFKLASNNADPTFCTNVLTTNDELGEVFNKYNILIEGKIKTAINSNEVGSSGQNIPSLLDLTPSPTQNIITNATDHLSQISLNASSVPLPESDYLTSLDEIFNTAPSLTQNSLKFQSLPSVPCKGEPVNKTSIGKNKGFEELDMLGESLKENLLSSSKNVVISARKNSNPSLNEMNKKGKDEPLIESPAPPSPGLLRNFTQEPERSSDKISLDEPLLGDYEDQKMLLPDENKLGDHKLSELPKVKLKEEADVLPLGDIYISLQNIKPSSVTPFHALEEHNGISVVIHLAKDCPRPDVSVFVVTTSSKSQSPISNFLFQPVVPKCCRLRLLPLSGTSLPAHNPFLPPSAITQIMLIGSPTKDPIVFKYVISYVMEEETVTEMGEIKDLPLEEPTVKFEQ